MTDLRIRKAKDAEKGRDSQGRTQFLRHMDGEKITRKQAMLAKCFDCMGYYRDGRRDCKESICPLYPYAPYRIKNKPPNFAEEGRGEN